MTDAVRVEELTRTFGDFTAVDAVSFAVTPGEIFGFLGPNGAGKTTTIKMLTALLRPTSGRAMVAGFDVVRESRAIKYRIGYMSQLFSLYGDLTVEENIALFAGLYGVTGERFRQRRQWVLEMSHLGAHRHQPTATLPLGWKQRLALGCALVHEPPILFLDEPTSGVDPVARRDFWDLIDSFASGGTTVFVSTHYMEEAEYCHRLALMNRGRLIALATPQALRTSMIDPIMQLETDDPPRAVETLQRLPVVIEASLYGRSVHAVVDDRATARQTIPAALDRAGLHCERLDEVSPSLEDVFVALVRQQGGAAAG